MKFFAIKVHQSVCSIYRTSSAAEYFAYRDKNIIEQHFTNDLRGSSVMGPIKSLMDKWTPERPPKNPLLRVPSPDLPSPPSPLINNPEHHDDPFPPPPSAEILQNMHESLSSSRLNNANNRRNSFAGSSSSTATSKSFSKSNNYDKLSPPLLPRKPNSMELFNPRPFSSMRQPHGFQIKKASQTQNVMNTNKMAVNGACEKSMANGIVDSTSNTISSHLISNRIRSNKNRMSIRKRAHNASMSVVPPNENHAR